MDVQTYRNILACKQTKHWWDPDAAPFRVTHSKIGSMRFTQTLICERCETIRTENCYPRLPLERIGNYGYKYPPGWEEVQVYWSDARNERVQRGFQKIEEIQS